MVIIFFNIYIFTSLLTLEHLSFLGNKAEVDQSQKCNLSFSVTQSHREKFQEELTDLSGNIMKYMSKVINLDQVIYMYILFLMLLSQFRSNHKQPSFAKLILIGLL